MSRPCGQRSMTLRQNRATFVGAKTQDWREGVISASSVARALECIRSTSACRQLLASRRLSGRKRIGPNDRARVRRRPESRAPKIPQSSQPARAVGFAALLKRLKAPILVPFSSHAVVAFGSPGSGKAVRRRADREGDRGACACWLCWADFLAAFPRMFKASVQWESFEQQELKHCEVSSHVGSRELRTPSKPGAPHVLGVPLPQAQADLARVSAEALSAKAPGERDSTLSALGTSASQEPDLRFARGCTIQSCHEGAAAANSHSNTVLNKRECACTDVGS